MPSASAISFWVIGMLNASAGGMPALRRRSWSSTSRCAMRAVAWSAPMHTICCSRMNASWNSRSCDAGSGMECTDAHDLLFQEAFILAADPAQCGPQARRFAEHLHQLGAGKFGKLSVGNRLHAGIALREQGAVKPDAVARQQEIDDLAMPVGGSAKADCPSGNDNTCPFDGRFFALHNASGRIVGGLAVQPIEDFDVLVLDQLEAVESFMQRFHDAHPMSETRISDISSPACSRGPAPDRTSSPLNIRSAYSIRGRLRRIRLTRGTGFGADRPVGLSAIVHWSRTSPE